MDPGPEPRAALPHDFDHVAIAVRSISESLPLLERLCGVSGSPVEQVPSQGVSVCFAGPVELIEPLDPTNAVGRFLEKRGQGFHHIAFRVPDVAQAMSELVADGLEFTSSQPLEGHGGHSVAFIHPSSTGGLLIELVEK